MILALLLASFALGVLVARALFHRDPIDHGEYRRTVRFPAPYSEIPSDIEHEDKFIVNRDGMLLYTRRFVPASGEIKAVIGFCHGFGDHSSWFVKNNAIKLARHGFAVICMDSRGHGKSDGLHAYVPDFNELVMDWREFFASQMNSQRFKGKKLFVLGASMGGAMAIQLARKFADELPLGGCVLCAPMCKIADALKPPQAIVDLATTIAPLFPEAAITPSKNVVPSAFQDPTILAEAYRNPLGYRKKPRLGTALELLRVTDEIEKSLGEFAAPFVVLHGTADMVTDVEVSKELYNRACSTDKSIQLYEGRWHALLEEDHDGKVMADIVSWINKRV